jgi:hypothetical protein
MQGCGRLSGSVLGIAIGDNPRSTTNKESDQGNQHDAHFARIATGLADTGRDCLVDDAA